jgi:azurin
MPGHEREQVTLLAQLLADRETGAAALAALRRIPSPFWPAGQLTEIADGMLEYLRAFPPGERTGSDFGEAVAFGRDLATRLAAGDASRVTAALDELVVRTIRITAIVGEMRFDISEFTVNTGEEIEVELVNPDHMPHNLLITIPGALESVALQAEAMAATPDGFARGFVPDTPQVLHATPLIDQNQTARLRFTAPAEPGNHPFVCTFPGHWRTMNGVMRVVRPPAPTAAP